MAEDSSGSIWFGTKHGVRVYDGLEFNRLDSLRDPEGIWDVPVRTLQWSQKFGMLVGNRQGLYAHSLMGPVSLLPRVQGVDWYVSSVAVSEDVIWVGSAWGLARIDKSRVVLFTMERLVPVVSSLFPGIDAISIPSTASQRVLGNDSRVGIGALLVPERDSDPRPRVIGAIAKNGPAHRAGLKVGDKVRIAGVPGVFSGPIIAKANRLIGPLGTSITLHINRKDVEPFDVVVERAGRNISGFSHFEVYDVIVATDGSVWIALERGKVIRVGLRDGEPVVFESFAPDEHRPHFFSGQQPRILESRNGDIWVVSNGSDGNIHRRSSGGAWESIDLTALDPRGSRINPSIAETRDGTIWVGSDSGSLYKFQDGQWSSFHSPDQIPIPTVRTTWLLETSDGALWLIGRHKNAHRFDYKTERWSTISNLSYQAESRDGSVWFLGENFLVRQKQGAWEKFAPADGLMSHPTGLFVAPSGSIWAVGYTLSAEDDRSYAAVSRFSEKNGWVTTEFRQLSTRMNEGAVLEDIDRTLWFGSTGDRYLDQDGGVVAYRDGQWNHYAPMRVPWHSLSIAQTLDGRVWFGGSGLHSYQNGKFRAYDRPQIGFGSWINAVVNTTDGSLWVGTDEDGAFRLAEGRWTRYHVNDGLGDNSVGAILEMNDGSILVSTGGGVSRYDGVTWTGNVLPKTLLPISKRGLRTDSRRGLWINRKGSAHRYQPDEKEPETRFESATRRIPHNEEGVFSWSAKDAWGATPDSELQFSYRLDRQEWSPYSSRTVVALSDLAAGQHIIQVRARDSDFNVDETPARVAFVVLGPVWRQPVVVIPSAIALMALSIQSFRVVKRGRLLRASNSVLQSQRNELIGEIEKRERIEADRSRLDIQLRQLRYLDRLRASLDDVLTPKDVLRRSCGSLLGVLSDFPSARVEITYDHLSEIQGAGDRGMYLYERPLAWNERIRGRLILSCRLELSETQERALLDETAGQISRVLQAQELSMQLLQSARLVSMGQMAAGVAHELNQPLGGISATTEDYYLRLQEGLDVTPGQWREMLQRILGMVERMSETVDHLRVFSRDTSQEPGIAYDINGVVSDSLGIIGTQLQNHGIQVTQDLGDNLPELNGHPRQIEQVLLNLLGNARDAVDARGEKDPAFEKQIVLTTRLTEDAIALAVQDNGEGIDPDHIGRLFEPFFTTKPEDKGTGLGLSISYAIVKNHGGDITVDCSDGRTVFTVILPLSRDTESSYEVETT